MSALKKGKKMPSIELEGYSEARFVLRDGKIVRVEDASKGESGSEKMAPQAAAGGVAGPAVHGKG